MILAKVSFYQLQLQLLQMCYKALHIMQMNYYVMSMAIIIQ